MKFHGIGGENGLGVVRSRGALKQGDEPDSQRLCEMLEIHVRNAAALEFDFCNAASGDVPASPLQPDRQFRLRPIQRGPESSHLRPDNVQTFHSRYWDFAMEAIVLFAAICAARGATLRFLKIVCPIGGQAYRSFGSRCGSRRLNITFFTESLGRRLDSKNRLGNRFTERRVIWRRNEGSSLSLSYDSSPNKLFNNTFLPPFYFKKRYNIGELLFSVYRCRFQNRQTAPRQGYVSTAWSNPNAILSRRHFCTLGKARIRFPLRPTESPLPRPARPRTTTPRLGRHPQGKDTCAGSRFAIDQKPSGQERFPL